MADNFSDAIKGMLMGENELLTAAVQRHNLYAAYIKAGFTEKQAMQLLIGIIRPISPGQVNVGEKMRNMKYFIKATGYDQNEVEVNLSNEELNGTLKTLKALNDSNGYGDQFELKDENGNVLLTWL